MSIPLLQQAFGNRRLLQLRRLAQRQAAPWVGAALGITPADEQGYEARQEMLAAADDVAVPGGGQPLDAGLRAQAEQHLGVPLDGVRVLTDAASCDALGAEAFATPDGGGHAIVMADAASRFTLLHELAHVAQQRRGETGALDGLGGDDGCRDQLERQADRAATQMLSR